MNVLLSFVLHDLNGTLFVRANLLSEWLFAIGHQKASKPSMNFSDSSPSSDKLSSLMYLE